jgi:uncharacterized membrane protein YfcA
MGIGGGLAITVGLTAGLKVPQRQAQMVSLALSVVPTTIPAAWVYWREGQLATWSVVLAVIAGLIVGTDIGARLANRLGRRALYVALIGFVSATAFYMAHEALA